MAHRAARKPGKTKFALRAQAEAAIIRERIAKGEIPIQWYRTLVADIYRAYNVALPSRWWETGSEALVLALLVEDWGVQIEDPPHNLTNLLAKRIPGRPSAQNVGTWMRGLESQGLIKRTILGKTSLKYCEVTAAGIAHLNGQPAFPPPPNPQDVPVSIRQAVPTPVGTAPTMTSTPAEYIDLARTVLRLSEERDSWRGKFDQAETNISDLVTRLGDAHEEITRLRALVPEATPVTSDGQSDYSVGARLSASENEALQRVLSEITGT